MSVWCHVDTVLGRFHVVAEEDAIVRSYLPGATPTLPPGPARPDHPVLRLATRQLQAWTEGDLQEFTVPLRLDGTGFQQRVWHALQAIPYGRTATYGEIADAVGRPGGARAVGQANNRNPVAPFVPCHRVVAAGGGLGGYGGGERLKQAMLDLESRIGGGDSDTAMQRQVA